MKRLAIAALTAAAILPAVVGARTEDPETAPELSVHRGGIVFMHYCVNCHGLTADGNGRMAKLYNPRPANLVTSDKNDAYKELIIRRGGGALGRSNFMPPWGEELTSEQIKDVIAFLRLIQKPPQN